ncbi:hypothetical protein LCGC14_1267850 [marine sediment metagenome]|uniref:Guanylate cyclase domain-containing protein n=1 Tax=marine sediment metagenome TaxID=412755 RepID=A0A0F9NFN1_9ZZZZ
MNIGSVVTLAKDNLNKIIEIGDLPQDSDERITEHHFMIYMGLLMSIGGVFWGSICFFYGLHFPSLIPYSYTILTIVNFIYFNFSKNFKLCRFYQVLMSMLLPFAFRWSLGGFISSGAVMLWAIISLVGSLTFQDIKLGMKWLMAYLGLTLFSGFIDSKLNDFRIEVDPQITTIFFVINLAIISTIVFILSSYLLAKRDEAKEKVAEMSSLLKKMFGRYLSTEVMNALIENPSALDLGGERRKVTIMMTDLRGFTALSERLEPEQVVQMLNAYFEIMVDLVLKYNGNINEFIGDALLVIFGAPQEMEDRAQRAVACAIEMQNAMVEVNKRNCAEGLPEVEMGIGLNETEVIVGNIGSSKRSKYAVVGSGVNLTSRIESYTVGGQILVSESVRKEAGEVLRIDAQRDILPKGAVSSLRIYEVGGISGQYNFTLVNKTQTLTNLARQIPLLYTVIKGKKVGQKGIEGLLRRLSKSGTEITLGDTVELMTNLKLKLNDVDEQLSAKDFYGKVIKRHGEKENTYMVSFTSLPSEIDAYFQACRQYAAVASAGEDV